MKAQKYSKKSKGESTQYGNSTKESILLHIKNNGSMCVNELCALLNISSMAVRRHLSDLIAQNLITTQTTKQITGRPLTKYLLTDSSKSYFPDNYSNFAREILDVIKVEYGPSEVMAILQKRDETRLIELKELLQGKTLDEKIHFIVELFNRDGYMTEFKVLDNGDYMIYQKNCALHDLAKSYRQICSLEPKFIENLLGVKITRKEYLFDNSNYCGYLVENN